MNLKLQKKDAEVRLEISGLLDDNQDIEACQSKWLGDILQ